MLHLCIKKSASNALIFITFYGISHKNFKYFISKEQLMYLITTDVFVLLIKTFVNIIYCTKI